MEHSFDIDIAKEYGVNCAILLKYIWFWIEKNKANGKHEYEGKFWTYNSVKAFEELFPYMSGKAIRTALQKLEDDGLIETGQFNEKSYDRTKWYCITPKGQMHLSKRANGSSQKGKPIPDIYTVNNNVSVSNTYSFSNNSNVNNLRYILNNNLHSDTDYLKDNKNLYESIKEWMIYKDNKKPYSTNHYDTEMGIKKLLTSIIEHSKEYGVSEVIKTIDKSISNNYQGIIWSDLEKRGKKKTVSNAEKPIRSKPTPKPKPEDDGRLPMEEYMKLNPNI